MWASSGLCANHLHVLATCWAITGINYLFFISALLQFEAGACFLVFMPVRALKRYLRKTLPALGIVVAIRTDTGARETLAASYTVITLRLTSPRAR